MNIKLVLGMAAWLALYLVANGFMLLGLAAVAYLPPEINHAAGFAAFGAAGVTFLIIIMALWDMVTS